MSELFSYNQLPGPLPVGLSVRVKNPDTDALLTIYDAAGAAITQATFVTDSAGDFVFGMGATPTIFNVDIEIGGLGTVADLSWNAGVMYPLDRIVVLGTKQLNALTNTTGTNTGDQNITELNPDYVTYNTAPATSSTAQATVSWNSAELTLDLIQNGTTLQMGQEMQFPPVRNNIGSTLLNGIAAMATGTIGASGRITIAKMDASVASNAKFFIGILTEDILDTADGKATTFGKVRQLNTSAWNEGDVLYLDPAVLGGLTTVEPTYPNMSMAVGFVITKHATVGTIMVRVNNLDTNAFAAPDDVLPRSAWNGTFAESFNCIPSSDGATITVSLEKEGGGDLTMQFSDGLTTLDCTPACTATLTAGSATVYQKNYIYVLQATKLLTVSTTGWPAGEHIKVSFQCVFTAAVVQTEDAFIHQDWNDELSDTNGMGHITHIGQLLREGRGWFSGVDGAGTTGYLTIGVGTATVQATAGVIKQVHTHTYVAKDTAVSDDIHVVNDPTTPYLEITDLTSLTQDSTGATLNNKYFNVVLAGTSNKSGQYSPMLLLLPSGSYNSSSTAEQDTSGYTSTALPREFTKDSSNGFLITRLTLRLTGGNIVHVATEDLRGTESGSGGAGNAAVTEFPDSTFRIQNTADPTKEIDFDASAITTGTTRTITMPDRDVDLGSLIDYANPIAINTAGTVVVTSGSYYIISDLAVPADYQIAFDVSGLATNDTFGWRIADGTTKLITITTLAGTVKFLPETETVTSPTTAISRVMWEGENVVVQHNGTDLMAISGNGHKMVAKMTSSLATALVDGVFKSANYDTIYSNIGGMVDTANDRIVIRRGSKYNFTAGSVVSTTGSPTSLLTTFIVQKNAATVEDAVALVGAVVSGASVFGAATLSNSFASLSAGDNMTYLVRTSWGLASVYSTLGNGAPVFSVEEAQAWPTL